MTKRLIVAGGVTLLGFPVLGWVLLALFAEGDPLAIMTRSATGFWRQAWLGTTVGIVGGLAATWLVGRPFMKSIEAKYASFIYDMNLSWPAIIALSFCAGFGEELLFRGAVQPFLGIWITAVIFVAIHGYLSPFNWRISVYGLFMTGMIAFFGYLTEWEGIWAACFAHMMVDIILFRHLVRKGRSIKNAYTYIHEDP